MTTMTAAMSAEFINCLIIIGSGAFIVSVLISEW